MTVDAVDKPASVNNVNGDTCLLGQRILGTGPRFVADKLVREKIDSLVVALG